jgi:carboxyl-terminal processing protease
MKRSPARNVLLGAVLVGAACVGGGLLGGGVQADTKELDRSMRTFSQVLALLETQYIHPVESEELIESAIRGMLAKLDPHSNYLSPDAFSEMKDEQRGRFSGLGIQISKLPPDGTLTIIAPIEGTPASRAGLQAGDIIYRIEGEETADLTVQDAVRKLKGQRGTKVTITIQRPGEGSEFDVTVVRDVIPIDSLRAAFMLEPGVGYIHIINFTSTTTRELDDAIARLLEEGMDRLLLDLRGNPGGLLEQAVQISERFVKEGELVVYTRGRINGSDQDYFAGNDVERVKVPLVVLVDRGSASASEIVSGAIQDHDRGLVVGETTFGKGLVQRVIPLSNNGALAVTTAKYYTPSGRLIQRDFSDREEYFMPRGLLEGGEGEEEVAPQEPEEPQEREVFRTDAGRVVYGGGGITPDYEVPARTMPALLSQMVRENLIFDFAVLHNSRHEKMAKGVPFGDEQVKELREFLASREFEYDAEAFQEHLDLIVLRTRAQIARGRWNAEEEIRVFSEADPQIRKAMEVFDEAARLADLEPVSIEDEHRIADLGTSAGPSETTQRQP